MTRKSMDADDKTRRRPPPSDKTRPVNAGPGPRSCRSVGLQSSLTDRPIQLFANRNSTELAFVPSCCKQTAATLPNRHKIQVSQKISVRSDTGEGKVFEEWVGEAPVCGFEILPQPSERLCTQKPGWRIAY
jgi:hypothetical protein